MKTNNTKQFLPFDNFLDLLRKVEVLKTAHKLQAATLREGLDGKGVSYTPINEFYTAIDVSLLSDENKQFVEMMVNNSQLPGAYDKVGVVSKI